LLAGKFGQTVQVGLNDRGADFRNVEMPERYLRENQLALPVVFDGFPEAVEVRAVEKYPYDLGKITGH
jgi:hypothetical protein